VQQKVDDVLAKANQRIEEGKLIEPANDNARYYYDLVLGNDPSNAAARAGLTAVASKLALNARAEIDAGNFDDAGSILAEARDVDPESVEVAATIDALKSARRSTNDDRNRAEQQRAAAEKRAADRAAAEKKAAEQKAAELKAAEANAAEEKVAQQAAPVEQPDTSSEAAAADTAQPEQAAAEEIVPVGLLNRTKYVAPKYPRSAQRRGISGWVDVVFTVNADGLVEDVTVRDSDPGDTFVTAAEKAVEKWEFEPIVEDGRAVSKRAAVRMMFAIE
jgi:protein TonB